MKKKLVPLILALVCAIACAFGLAACGGGGDNNPPPVTPKTVQATVNVNCDFECTDYITMVDLSFGGYSTSSSGQNNMLFNVSPRETTDLDDAKLKISFKRGYNPETLGVTEKDGKPVTKEYDTQNNKNDVIIKMPFAENLEYDITLTAPMGIRKTVGFEVDNPSNLENISAGAYLNLLTNTQVWVENADGEEHAGFVSLTREDINNPTDRIYNIGQQWIKADMSKTTFAVYVRFDSNDSVRMIYDTTKYKNLFTFDGVTAQSVKYTLIPGTNEYAYAFEFYTSNISETNSRLALNTQSLADIGYRKDTINQSFSVVTYENKSTGIKYTYNFKLDCYWEEGVEKDPKSDTPYKEYEKSYKLQYSIDNVTITGGSLSEDERTTLANKLKAPQYTDFANIKLTLNGKVLTGATPHESGWYEYTIGAEEIPCTYSGEPDNAFKFGVDATSVNAKQSSNVINITAPKGGSVGFVGNSEDLTFNKYETENEQKATFIFNNKSSSQITYYVGLPEFDSFDLKITLNGVLAVNKTFYITDAANDDIHIEYGDTGDENSSYIFMWFNDSGDKIGLNIRIGDKENPTKPTNIVIEISGVELAENN